MSDFLDVHCHILPGVDDGAPDMETALDMARLFVAQGYTALAPSPHFGVGPGGHVPKDVADNARQALREALATEGIALEILPGSEHHMSPELFQAITQGEVTPVGGASKWLLTEFPWQPIARVEDLLFRLQTTGHKVLLAHPERQPYLDFDLLGRLVERGVCLQLEIGSFVGVYGRSAQSMAMRLADEGLAHIFASDLHHTKRSSQWLPAGLKAITDRYGKGALIRGLTENPRALVADAGVSDIRPATG